MSIFAKRTNYWEGTSNPLDKALHAQATPATLCDLTQSNPTQAGIIYPDAWFSALNQPQSFVYDPQSFGLLTARQAVSDYYQRRGYTVDTDRIILTASSSDSYAHLLRLLVNPHEKVLIPAPSYPLFPYLLDIHDAAYDTYALRPDHNWSIDREDLLARLDKSVKIIMIVSPNNPTGSYISDEDMHWLSGIARDNNIALVADEVFMDYKFDQGGKSFLNQSGCLTFVIGGLSKTICLPGMKLGWLIASGPKELVDAAYQRLEIMADTYLSVNTPVQLAAPQWLKDVDIIQDQVMVRLKSNLKFAKDNCSAQIKLLEPQGGWYVIAQLPEGIDDEQFCLKALSRGVLLYPGYFFDMPWDNYIVASLLTQSDIFQRGWNIFNEAVQSDV